jgi:hypothetical protein
MNSRSFGSIALPVNGMMKAPEDRKRVIIFREHRQVQVHEWTLTTI